MPFYSQWFKNLSNFEVSPSIMWIAGLSFVIALMFLLREFFSWMVKQNEVREELGGIRSELEILKELLKDTSSSAKSETSASVQPTFPLDIAQTQSRSFEN